MWHAPPCCFNDLRWAAKRNRQIRLDHVITGFGLTHPFLNRSTKSIDTLPRVTNCNRTSAFIDVPREHFMVNGREILPLVPDDIVILRECSPKQCGHVYLIVKVNVPKEGGFD